MYVEANPLQNGSVAISSERSVCFLTVVSNVIFLIHVELIIHITYDYELKVARRSEIIRLVFLVPCNATLPTLDFMLLSHMALPNT